ncbi:MAG: hypothetical protein A3C93_00435 [Candidatus Lloydbacteria bacterium RIFCSPHIGHO2_02_FULL_54_17]|uniref:Uncharacterized protein n=1 Tax=Candidatus Lloydbacteria bacterium RIFCSPHIGHO2_02_FULL_54_17 TaxID=1798664 RepID=A0A1G2DDZ0_9BACT|nr:MAG: hypothetical protein A2762_01865 [Candidatus Lloydbacteria bacterium RIFCSPHIGHO2_01_FULL_54_11]OGZ11855.1 MAG: hypothetical protein A3C93_00435 [Candidatus Lloydbacteria bacterium RIFCSPHIGHO2_02_FULL_54_17]OGZ14124.1 MAG: hypothetical protein A2948_03350 [Candidatus Lloydbacteria bacterium RIFCSPLOWO2_01_FULL_54_18]OGZ16699.1 MAG: hypothetical protein A3H76_00140 [Candidatus Lloydbacteria bacterium RIFCSPLOWO2_02_FULL_54_12]
MGWSTQSLIDHARGEASFEATYEKVETHTMKGACTECQKPFDLTFKFVNDQPVDCQDNYECSCRKFWIWPEFNEWSYRG